VHYFKWYSVNHSFVFYHIIASLYKDSTGAPEYQEGQRNWLSSELEEASHANHILIFQHHPWFLEKHDEEEGYFNLPKSTRMETLELFQKHNVSAIFAGHYHRNSVAKWKNLLMVTTTAIGRQLGSDVSGFRVVTVHKDRIDHQFVPLSDETSFV
jgi:hypothetical protein